MLLKQNNSTIGGIMISPHQIRAARALLDWHVKDLADKSGLTRDTIANVESGRHQPRSETLLLITTTLNQHGIEFTEHDGVRRKVEELEVYEGKDRFNQFTDFVYHHIMEIGGDIRIMASDERLFLKYRIDHENYRKKMLDYVGSGRGRVLIIAEQSNFKSLFAIIKKSPIKTNAPTSYYTFGNCIGLISFENKNPPRVILIKDAALADSYKKSFDTIWEIIEE